MAIEFNGRMIATTATGYLENREDWSENLARLPFPRIISARSDDAIRTRLVW